MAELFSTARLCGCALCAGLRAGASDGSSSTSTGSGLAGIGTSGVVEVDSLIGTGTSRWNADAVTGTAVTVTYSFMAGVPDYYSVSDGIESFQPFNEAQKAAARSVLASYAAIADITFVEVPDGGAGGQIRFGTEAMERGVGAYTYLPAGTQRSGDVWINSSYSESLEPEAGDYAYYTLLHEIGHAIGLKHPGNYNSTGDAMAGPFLSKAADNTSNTVMSYTIGAGHYPTTLAPYDIDAIQFLYGPKTAKTIGRLTAGDGADDQITGDDRGNSLLGRGGADTLVGGAGEDGLLGEGGDDLIYGNRDRDLLYGGDGHDRLFGGQDADTLHAGTNGDVAYGNMAADFLFGEAGDDSLYGGQGDDSLQGGSGGDWLFGNRGDDRLEGGDGADRFVFTSHGGTDTVIDFDPSEGDRLVLEVGRSWTLTANRGVAVLSFGGGSVTLAGISAGDFDAAWILPA